MDALELLTALESFDLSGTIVESVESEMDYFVEVQQDQLLHGEKSDKRLIGEYRFPWYAELKLRKNPLAEGSVDLKLTGTFYNSMKASVEGENIVMKTDDPNELMRRYNGDGLLFGLNPESAGDFGQKVLQTFIPKFEKQTGLSFD